MEEYWNNYETDSQVFLFDEFSPRALADTLRFVLHCWSDRAGWEQLVQNAMAQDFSWERQTDRYVELYRRLTDS